MGHAHQQHTSARAYDHAKLLPVPVLNLPDGGLGVAPCPPPCAALCRTWRPPMGSGRRPSCTPCMHEGQGGEAPTTQKVCRRSPPEGAIALRGPPDVAFPSRALGVGSPWRPGRPPVGQTASPAATVGTMRRGGDPQNHRGT